MNEPNLVDTGFAPEASALVSGDHARLLAATLDADPLVLEAGILPLPWHWTCLLPAVRTRDLGSDGHPRRRDDMAAFAHRMWVGGRVRSLQPLLIGETARRTSRVLAAELKEGATGRFWLITVGHVVTQLGEVRVEEEQDLVLREASIPAASAAPGAAPVDAPEDDWIEERVADPVLLFRYSALTFHAHRIHYDQPYATGVEGYPDLVVHGPLTATLLCELARRHSGRPVREIDFRARVPLFANRKFWLAGHATDSGAELAAVRADGQVAMTLTAAI